tara:strand:- start:6682 stop:6963 length:282 start_codon:yes stop_codon:yes gene_type:complete
LGISEGSLVDGVGAQTTQALANAQHVLSENGLTLGDVVKCTVFMTDIENFSVVNDAYAEVFGDHRPSRSAIAVKALPLGGLVEIEAIAYMTDG